MQVYIVIILSIMINIVLFVPFKNTINGENVSDISDMSVSIKCRGIFAVWVIINHYFAYVNYPDKLAKGIAWVLRHGAVLSVTGFFFFSVFGFLAQLHSKGKKYLKGYWFNKITKIYIPFAITNFIAIVLSLPAMGGKYNGNWVGDIVGIGHINAPTWYIYEIFVYYLLFYLLTKIIYRKESDELLIAKIIIVINIISCLVMWLCNINFIYYSGAIGITGGSIYFIYRDKFIHSKLILENRLGILLASGITSEIFMVLIKFVLHYNHASELLRIVMCLLFVFFMADFCLCFKFGNRITTFIGKCSLEIYLIHGSILLLLFEQNNMLSSQNLIIKWFLMVGVSCLSGIVLHFLYFKILKIKDGLVMFAKENPRK